MRSALLRSQPGNSKRVFESRHRLGKQEDAPKFDSPAFSRDCFQQVESIYKSSNYALAYNRTAIDQRSEHDVQQTRLLETVSDVRQQRGLRITSRRIRFSEIERRGKAT